MAASHNGHTESQKVLLEAGADVSLHDEVCSVYMKYFTDDIISVEWCDCLDVGFQRRLH